MSAEPVIAVEPVRPRHRARPIDRRRRAADDGALFRRYHATRDRADRDALVERFLPLARHMAARYSGGPEPFDDLFQVACVALMLAVERFDPDRHAAFSSYAVPTIAGELKRHFRDKTWSVRVPRGLRELAVSVQRADERMAGELGRAPTATELARATSAPEERIRDAVVAMDARAPMSLDGWAHGREAAHEALHTPAGAEDGYGDVERRVYIEALTAHLPAHQRVFLRLHYDDDLTQREISERFGVSQARVSRALNDALKRMRASVREPAERP